MTTEPNRPLIRVTRGQPDDTEIAALTAAILALLSRTEMVQPDTTKRRVPSHTALPAGSWRAGPI